MATDPLRAAAHGTPPLAARLEPWMRDLLSDPGECDRLLRTYGSPVNVHDFTPLQRNAAEMVQSGARHGVPLRVFVARKANKTLGLVEAVKDLGHGIDVASERELRQVLDLGMSPADIILTAAVKPERLLRLAMERGVPVALDNLDEALLAQQVSSGLPAPSPVVLRMAPEPAEGLAPTRFGESAETWLSFLDDHPLEAAGQRVDGIHFHLHGYSARDRAVALTQAIEFIDRLREGGHAPSFIDMGGGVPMSYLNDGEQWATFWEQHEADLLDGGTTQTWRGDGLGLRVEDHSEGPRLTGVRDVYPYHQSPVRGEWLDAVLTTQIAPGVTVAQALNERGITLRCEPGRSMLDGCGLTLARVVFRKHTSDGVPIVGLEMNRTQCRSTSADFLVDPVLVRTGSQARGASHKEAWNGNDGAFLVGAYCIEAELILRRRICFPAGIDVGDVIALPNTAGYLMHILESASHQIPLAANVVRSGAEFVRDGIDLG
ncbi:Y4yA family PLP-dependent enzyme [Kocuria soli]|uniref:Y4yA family PLP-dependent enzyme n=2 Tax=Kocuria soli TaxID=2485125 RepID=A0A3N3ZR57_9MICC|nr:Y4yA family PLP-dependent enzyme [Kocuria soli]